MRATRNAALPAPSANTQVKSKQKNATTRAVISQSSQPQARTALANQIEPVGGPRPRKRVRNGQITGDQSPILSGLPSGERSPNAKRTKSQAGAPYLSMQSHSTSKDPGLNPEQIHKTQNVPYFTNDDVSIHRPFASLQDSDLPFFPRDLELRTQCMPVLDNLATQILNLIAKSSHQEILGMMAASPSSTGQQWSQLAELFTETKKVYTDLSPFLSAQSLGLSGKPYIDTIKKANLATFVCGLFGGREDIGFEHLNTWFLDSFSVDGTKLLKPQAQLFLDFKTQAYISAVASNKAAIVQGQSNTIDILNALFPSDLDRYFLQRRNGAIQLSAIERQFIEQARIQSKKLVDNSQSAEAIDSLPSMHPWEAFLKAVQNYVKSNLDELMGNTTSAMRRPGRPRQDQNVFRPDYGDQDLQPQGNAGQLGQEDPQIESIPNPSNDIAEKAARAAHFAMETFGNDVRPMSSTLSQTQRLQDHRTPSQHQGQASQASGPPIQFHFEKPLHPNVPSPPAPFFTQIPYQNGQMQGQWHPRSGRDGQLSQSYEAEGMIPYPTQSAPTHVLYERARQAASSKSSQQQTPRKVTANTPAQRRPWTPDEENALMAGLDRVKGPHWSQIHAMFGPGGTINDVLKDRNQVQLKDKARNLKLFFLKSNIEVPYYLQFVTGELKTRAPSRVVKNEARQKAMSDEDRAHVQGVMTLAGSANATDDNPDDEQEEETEQQHMLRLAVSATNDVNIDPDLEAQLRQATAEEDTHSGLSGGRYTVPTPNMLMQRVEKYIAASNAAQSSDR